MAQKVDKVKTPASEDMIVSAIKTAWSKIFGETPNLAQIGKAWAQIAIECGHGQYIFNNNVGNMNWTKGFSGDYYETKDSITVGNNPANRRVYTAKMRSYSNLLQGVADYLHLLKNRPGVMKALQTGSPKDFSYALADVHYYDAHIRDDYVNKDGKKVGGYTSGLSNIYKQFMRKHEDGIQESHKPELKHESGFIANFLAGLGKLLDNLTAKNTMIHINKYGSKYPTNKYLIAVGSNDFSSKIEFARILSLALKEELDATTEIYTDGDHVEIQCFIDAKEAKGRVVIKELCAALSNAFEEAVKSYGIEAHTLITPNKDTHYQRLDIKVAESNYRKFRLKLARYDVKTN